MHLGKIMSISSIHKSTHRYHNSNFIYFFNFHQDLMDIIPTRRKRARNFEDGEKKSKGVKVYEYFESKRSKSKSPRNHGETITVVKTRTVGDTEKEPKHRSRLTHRRPRPHVHEAAEVEDLANDQYFYEQLEKSKPTTESSTEVEHVHDNRPNVNHEIIFHGSGKKREKHRQKLANVRDHGYPLKDVDVYGDYGEMVMPHRDVEMYETFEKNTHEAHVHEPPRQILYDDRLRPKKRQRIYHNVKTTQPHGSHKNQNLLIVHRPAKNKKFERIMVTKKINTPDQLHDEINKIFETKNKYYDKRGHDKAHWELRIVPQRYEQPEELTQI